MWRKNMFCSIILLILKPDNLCNKRSTDWSICHDSVIPFFWLSSSCTQYLCFNRTFECGLPRNFAGFLLSVYMFRKQRWLISKEWKGYVPRKRWWSTKKKRLAIMALQTLTKFRHLLVKWQLSVVLRGYIPWAKLLEQMTHLSQTNGK